MEQEFYDHHRALQAQGEQPQFYPLSYAQQGPAPLAQAPAPDQSLLTRQFGPLQVWGWGALALIGGGAYYFYSQSQKKPAKNGEGGGEVEANGSSHEGTGGFRTSRSEFAGKLRGYLQKNGHADVVLYDPTSRRTGSMTIFGDADDAKKKLKHVSPLVTMQCKTRPPVKDLDKFAKREGLSAVEHEDNVVGFYPGGGKKGKAWEQYIDDLRDDGQEV